MKREGVQWVEASERLSQLQQEFLDELSHHQMAELLVHGHPPEPGAVTETVFWALGGESEEVREN